MESSSGRAPHRHFSQLWMFTVFTITVTLFSGSFVTSAFGAPAKLDAIAPQPQTPFPLEAQPTLFTDAFSAALNRYNGKNSGDGGNNGGEGNSDFHKTRTTAIDSYGNPIETLKPIDTPDGRKVISAQGLQFEIPNYASGITEIKQPADDLLPPFIAPFDTTTASGSSNVAISTDPTKTTFTKSNEGKVITNNVFGAFSSVATPSKQFSFGTSTTTGQSTVQKGFQQSTSNTFASSTNSFAGSSSTFNKASTPSGFSTFASTQTSTNFGGLNKGAAGHATNIGAGKYTGSFGGSPGVLGNGKVGYALQTDGSIRSPSKGQAAVPAAHTTASKQPASPSIASRVGVAAPVGLNKFQGSFGGPPGVLVPFDNVKSG